VSESGGNNQRAKLVAATANRLRLVQSDFADEPEQVRKDYLSDEIQRALGTLIPNERKVFLEELKQFFPTWDAKVELGTEKQKVTVVQTATDQKELKDPGFLVTRLAELAPSLNEQQKHAIIEKLRQVGLAPSAVVGWPEQQAAALRAKMTAGPKDALEPGHVLELLTLLVELTASLDQVVWTTWRTIAPKSAIRRPAGLLKNMARFAASDPDVPRGQVSQDLERLRQLVAAVVAAIGNAGRQFAHNYATKFSPSEIEGLAAMERGGMLVSKEVKNWRKYVELSAGRDEATIESEIMQAIADYAESLMKGRG
jgi:anion-transporting  ArsA/GET3 family ATPase